MICKKCGAYNPDHATFCKVCAANLKDQAETDEAVQAEEVEEVVEEKVRPRRGNVKAPDFSAARRDGGFKAAPKVEEPVEEEDDEEEEPDDEEEVKPASRKSLFSRAAAPAKKRRVVDEEDEDEDEDDEDDYDEEDSDAEKLESEPKTTRFSRSAGKKRPVEEEEDDEDEDDEEDDEDDGYDDGDYDDEDDGYEEYEPTPPRRKKSGRSQGKSAGGPNVVTLLIVCLLAILLIIVGIVAFCNIKGGSTKSKLPGFLQFNCSGKASTEKTTQPQQQQQPVVPTANNQVSDPTEAPVTGTPVDYSATELEEFVDSEGRPCISISMTSRPGDTVTIVLPNQDDYVIQNNEASDVPYLLTIFKSCYYPKKPLEESVYTVTPEILVTHADGTQDSLHVDSFDLTFPTVQLELIEPAQATIPEEGIMAAEGNELLLKGKVDDHTVTVTVNGDRVVNMYTGGYFDYTYTLTGEEAETVNIEAVKDDYVSTGYSFTVNPYVFIPEKMTLDVVSDISKLKADKNNKVTVTGTTVPGTTLTATPAVEYQSSVACSSPVVDAEGHFSIVVNFYKDYYGVATITIHAQKDGYDPGETTCNVYRMYADRSKAVSGFNKNFHQIPSDYDYSKVLEDPVANGLYRFEGSVTAIDSETGVITFSAKINTKNKKDVATIYVVNAGSWKPKVGKDVKIYCTLNGLYSDGASLYATAWFYV